MTTKINSIKCKPTLKIYRTDGAQTGWEKRLDAIGSGTYLLHEEMDYSKTELSLKLAIAWESLNVSQTEKFTTAKAIGQSQKYSPIRLLAKTVTGMRSYFATASLSQ